MCKNLVPEIEGIFGKQEEESGLVHGAARTAVTGRQHNPGRERLTTWIRTLGRGWPFLSTPKSSYSSSARGHEDLRGPRVQS